MSRRTALLAANALLVAASAPGAWRHDDVGGCAGNFCATRIIPLQDGSAAVLLQSNLATTLYAIAALDTDNGNVSRVIGPDALKSARVSDVLTSHIADASNDGAALILGCRPDERSSGLCFWDASSGALKPLTLFNSSVYATDQSITAASTVLSPCLVPNVTTAGRDSSCVVALATQAGHNNNGARHSSGRMTDTRENSTGTRRWA